MNMLSNPFMQGFLLIMGIYLFVRIRSTYELVKEMNVKLDALHEQVQKQARPALTYGPIELRNQLTKENETA